MSLSNSALAILSLSGAKRRARAKTGGPRVRILCVTGVVTQGNDCVASTLGRVSRSQLKRSLEPTTIGLMDENVVIMPRTDKLCLVSTKRRLRTSTLRQKCSRKSSPRIGNGTSAMIKSHDICSAKLKLTVKRLLPNVRMGVPLAALSVRGAGGLFASVVDGGMTLTSAPVSTRN